MMNPHCDFFFSQNKEKKEEQKMSDCSLPLLAIREEMA